MIVAPVPAAMPVKRTVRLPLADTKKGMSAMYTNKTGIFHRMPKSLKWFPIIILSITFSLLFPQPIQAGDNGGSALSFDGNDTLQTAAVILSTTACTQPYTIELWLRTTNTVGGLVTQYQSIGSANRFGLRLNAGSLWWWHGSGASIISNGTVNDGRWHHVVATRNSGGTVNSVGITQSGAARMGGSCRLQMPALAVRADSPAQ